MGVAAWAEAVRARGPARFFAGERCVGVLRGAALRLAGFLLACALLAPSPGLAEKLVLSTLEWPPFVGSELPGQGRVAERVREISAAAGMSLELSFAPWKRVLLGVRTGSAQGYFPEYRSAEREKDFHYSVSVGCSVIGLIHRRDAALEWTRLEDLAPLRIGVVDGYVNTEEFDRLVARGVLRTVKCNSDTLAMRMVSAGRIDAAVMDREVFRHLLKQGDPSGTVLTFHPRILTTHTLHVCFPRTEAGSLLAERFDRAARALGAVGCPAVPH